MTDTQEDVIERARSKVAHLDEAMKDMADEITSLRSQNKVMREALERQQGELADWEKWYGDLREDFVGVTDLSCDPGRTHDWDWIDQYRPAPCIFEMHRENAALSPTSKDESP